MSYEVHVVDEFKKDIKKLFKKYKSIKGDILELIEVLEEDYSVGIHLGSDLYKIRVKNSDIVMLVVKVVDIELYTTQNFQTTPFIF